MGKNLEPCDARGLVYRRSHSHIPYDVNFPVARNQLGIVPKWIPALAERRKPSGLAKPVSLRPTATFELRNLFRDSSSGIARRGGRWVGRVRRQSVGGEKITNQRNDSIVSVLDHIVPSVFQPLDLGVGEDAFEAF